MEAKLTLLEKPLAELKKQVDEERKKLKLADVLPNPKDKASRLIDATFGAPKLVGYPITPSSSVNPTSYVQAAYNLCVVLDYAIKKAKNKSYLDLTVNDRKEITGALKNAIGLLVLRENAVVDETTAKVAGACAQLITEAAGLLNGIYPVLPDIVKAAVPEDAMGPAKDLAGAMKALFEMSESRYRIQEISKEIQTLMASDVLPDSQKLNELRQKLLNVLPVDLRQDDLPPGLNNDFFAAYYIKCSQYSMRIADIDLSYLANSESEFTSKVVKKFTEEKQSFCNIKGSLISFAQKTVRPLIQRIEPPPQPAPEVVVPPPIVPTVEATSPEPEKVSAPSVESLQTTESISSTETTITPDESKSTQNFQEPVIKESVVQEPVIKESVVQEPINDNEVDLEADKNNPNNVLKDEVLPPFVEKINEVTKEKEKLDVKFKGLDETITQLEGQIEKFNQDNNLASRAQKIAELKQELAGPNITELEQGRDALKEKVENTTVNIQAKQNTVQVQLKGLADLRMEIDADDKLTLDQIAHRATLDLLGINEGKINNYLALKEEENGFLNKASNFFGGLFSDTPSESTAKYQQQKREFLQAIDEKNRELINQKDNLYGQTEDRALLVELQTNLKQAEQKISSVKATSEELQKLNTELSNLEQEIAPIKQQMDEKKAEQTQVDEQRNTLTEQITNLESARQKLEQEIQEKLKQEEAAKRVEEAAKLKEEQEAKEKTLEAQNKDTTVDEQTAVELAEQKVQAVSSEDLSSSNNVAAVKSTEVVASVPKSIEATETEMLAKRDKLYTAKDEFLSYLPWNKSYQEKVKKGEDLSGRPGIGQALSAYITAWFDYKAAWKEFANAFKASDKDSWEAYKTKWETYRTEYKASKKEFTDSTASVQEGKSQDNSATPTYPPIPRAISFFSSLPTQKETPTSELDQKSGKTPPTTPTSIP